MHTFYQPAPKTGMDDVSDDRLLTAWKETWYAAGWEPRVISLEDAKQHPEYAHFDEMWSREGMPFGFYDKLCFMRWVAMAAVGGGWMSDYDTFPLMRSPTVMTKNGGRLPNDGAFTLYDKVGLAGGVPSLASGSQAEYERMSHMLLENTLEFGVKEKFWTDMYAFIDIAKRDRESYLVQNHVMKGRNAFTMWKRTRDLSDCEGMRGDEWAVHFSHASIKLAVRSHYLDDMPEFGGVANRPGIAQAFLEEWNVCYGKQASYGIVGHMRES